MSNMYERIIHLCERKGVTPGAMCREIGISRSIVTEMKSGRTKSLSAKNSKLIADYLGVTVEYLISGEKEKPLASEDQELEDLLQRLKTRKECRMLFQLADAATVEDVQKIVKIIEALRNEE